MKRPKRNRASSLAVLALGFCGGAPGWAAVTPGGDTTVAADSGSDSFIGNTGLGTLAIDGSTLRNYSGYVGHEAGSSGIATVIGAGSEWLNSGTLHLGYFGSGTLTISAGGQVSSGSGHLGRWAGSRGVATVTGAGSKWTSQLVVGHVGEGILTIDAGGRVSGGLSYVGFVPGAVGVVTVNGAASAWAINGNLYAGWYGSGTLNVQAGGKLSSSEGHMGYGEGSTATATVSGEGSAWTNQASLYIGESGSGTLTVNGGAQVSNTWGYMGYWAGSTGTVSVAGTGTRWTNQYDLYAGKDGSGVLTIEGGGEVFNSRGFVHGAVLVSGAGSRWTNQSHLYVGSSGHGTLAVEGGGLVTSASAHIGMGFHASGAVTISGTDSRWITSGGLFIAEGGNGTLTIEAGGQVTCGDGYVSATNSFVATASVIGPGSQWTNNASLNIGTYGTGTLAIRGGGRVGNATGYIGRYGVGTATVAGAGSAWTTQGTLYVGQDGIGTLTVADDAQVAAASLSISSLSSVHLHVSGHDLIALGTDTAAGSVVNKGTVSFYAGASLPAGVYHPISDCVGRAMIWSGTGAYKAFGGTWDTAAKTFTVVTPTSLSAGALDTITSGERLLFTDARTSQRVGASFGSITGTVSFSAAPMSVPDLAGLAGVLEEGRGVLSAWDFTTNFSGGEALLSFDVGTGAEGLEIWHYSGGVWSEFTPGLFTYDANGIASFTVSSFSGYAVTAAVPEPGMMGLLALAGSVLLIRRRPRG